MIEHNEHARKAFESPATKIVHLVWVFSAVLVCGIAVALFVAYGIGELQFYLFSFQL